MVGIERQVGAARLQDAEDRDQVLERAVGEDADALLRLDAAREQLAGHAVGVALELRVGEPPRALGRREGVGPLGRPGRHELVEARVLGNLRCGAVRLHASYVYTAMEEARRLAVVVVNYRTPELACEAVASLAGRARPGARRCASSSTTRPATAPPRPSSPGSADRGHDRFARVVRSERNGGFGAGNNLGLRAATAALHLL